MRLRRKGAVAAGLPDLFNARLDPPGAVPAKNARVFADNADVEHDIAAKEVSADSECDPRAATSGRSRF
jgi:hypothetical protein|tara:strand:+ start:5942 stop:6148 length:207 start_codon:yes stop_codon:yes gene_type:complete